MKLKVYVAGPYTASDEEGVLANVRTAIGVGNQLADAGFIPFVPHLVHFWHVNHPRDYEFWMELDFAFLPACDALLRINGRSRGADREVSLAARLGIPVYHSISDVIDNAKPRDNADKYDTLLTDAHSLINKNRKSAYGHAWDNFQVCADFWNVWLKKKLKYGEQVTNIDVGHMMSLLKKARERDGHSIENLIDDPGYIGTVAQIHAHNQRVALESKPPVEDVPKQTELATGNQCNACKREASCRWSHTHDPSLKFCGPCFRDRYGELPGGVPAMTTISDR